VWYGLRSMDRQESTALLRRARDGAPDALETLYQRVAGRLLGFIRLRLGRTLRAQLESRDILQATLLKSFEHLPQFEQSDSASLMAWLARIAENEIRDRADYHNRQRRDARLEVPLETVHAGVAASVRSVLSQLVLDERAERLERALEALDDHYREVIILRSFEELSFREIGARLGKTEDACRMLFARAMAALTMRMSAHAGGPGA
jgi:RNA polymerase sigma-70 factor (ECF subfamily)